MTCKSGKCGMRRRTPPSLDRLRNEVLVGGRLPDPTKAQQNRREQIWRRANLDRAARVAEMKEQAKVTHKAVLAYLDRVQKKDINELLTSYDEVERKLGAFIVERAKEYRPKRWWQFWKKA